MVITDLFEKRNNLSLISELSLISCLNLNATQVFLNQSLITEVSKEGTYEIHI